MQPNQMTDRNPLVNQWQQRVWDSVEYNIVKEGDKMILVQTHKRELKPEDVMDDYAYSKVALERIETTLADITKRPEMLQKWIEEEQPKLIKATEQDKAAFEDLHRQFDEIAKPEYDAVLKKGRDFINKYKVDKGYSRQDRYGKVEIREKALAAASDELKLIAGQGHPIISELRKECFE